MSEGANGLGGRIRRVRVAADLTQAELARAIGVSERTVVRWETDQHRPRLEHLLRIAGACGANVRDLMSGEDA